MRLSEFNEAAKIVDELEVLHKTGNTLLKTTAKTTAHNWNTSDTSQECPLSFLVQTPNGPEEVVIKDSILTWEIWDRLVDYLGKAVEDKEKELSRLYIKPRAILGEK